MNLIYKVLNTEFVVATFNICKSVVILNVCIYISCQKYWFDEEMEYIYVGIKPYGECIESGTPSFIYIINTTTLAKR